MDFPTSAAAATAPENTTQKVRTPFERGQWQVKKNLATTESQKLQAPTLSLPT